jgi:hypothetical protein
MTAEAMNCCFAQSSNAIHRHTFFVFGSEEGIGAF